MKKTLRKYLAMLSLLVTSIFLSTGWAQINYSANFDAGMQSWTSSDFFQFTGATACNTGALRTNLYSGNPDAILTSPSLGTASGGGVILSYDYKVANWSANTTGTPNPWGNFVIEYASAAGGPWTAIPGSTVNQSNHVVSGSCVTKTIGFTPPAGALYIRFNCVWSAGDYYMNFDNITLQDVPVPPTPTQAAGTPTCSAGTTIDVTGTPPAGVTWYWQSSATGTSTANPYSGPFTINSNGTYYMRALNTANNVWSVASSITVSNFPVVATPAAPTAGQNPACTPGTSLTMPAPAAGFVYYWQTGANPPFTTTNSAATPLNVTSTGTYYVATYETASQCWSATSSLAVTVNSVIPGNPTATPNNYNYCTTANPMTVAAQVPVLTGPQTCTVSGSASGTDNSGVTATVTNFSCPNGPISSATLASSISGSFCGTWYAYSIVVNGNTVATNQCNLSSFNLTPYLPLTSVSIVSADLDNFGDNVTLNLTVTLNYTGPLPSQPAYTIDWFSASTGGTQVGNTASMNALGTSVLPTPANGTYTFYAQTNLGNCMSPSRVPVTVTVSGVDAQLIPQNVTCNNLANGSFTLGTVNCGTQPFVYSVDGGAFGPIPTNLAAGTHTVIVKEQSSTVQSGVYTITITQPSAPAALNAFDINFFNAMLTWTPQGNETTWNVEYGPAGFTPGTGTTIPNATNDTVQAINLLPDTDYEFYVQAGCIGTSAWAGPFAFTTNAPYFTWDGDCGPGFIDISATGTNTNLTDDAEIGVTLPWAWNVNGTNVTTITIGNNGGILFNTLTGNVGYGIAGNGFYPYCQDLNTAVAGGGVFYQSIGTAPNRQFVVLWKDVPHYSFPASTDGSTFEVIYDEASGESYFVYQDVMMGNGSWNNGADAEIAAVTAGGTATVSMNSATYLANNSCAHFYNALCPNVQNLISIIYVNDATLNWDAGQYGETQWTLVYGEEGFDPTIPGQEIGTLNLNTSDTDFAGTLQQMTTYDVYIYSECTGDSLTSGGYFYQFTTKPNCADITGLAGMTDPDSLEVTWNWTSTGVLYPVTGFQIQYGMTGFTLGTGDIWNATGTNFADTVVDPTLIGSGVYQIYVRALCAGTNDSSNFVGPITVVMPATNDIVCSQELLQLNETYTFNNAAATVSLNETNIAPPATGAQTTTGWVNSTLNGTLWYTFVAPPSGSVRINSTAINYNGQAAVYTATNCADFNTFTLKAANDDAIGGGSSAPNFTVCGLTPGSTYYIMYDKFDATSGNFSLKITEIVLESGSANPVTNVCYGNTVDLYTTINGYDLNGTWSSNIPSVNASIVNDSLFTTNGLAYQTFNFQYRVTDGCAYDSIVSQVKIFPPSNAGQDGTITACRNEPIDLLAGLNGNADLNGDWYDTQNIIMANSQITTANFAGQYNYDYISGNGVCPNDTALVVVTVLSCNWLSVAENALEAVNIYPNPSTGLVYVESTFSTGNFDLIVMDVNGRTIQTSTNSITLGTNTIDLKEVERGTYFFKLSSDDAEKVFRVVIQ